MCTRIVFIIGCVILFGCHPKQPEPLQSKPEPEAYSEIPMLGRINRQIEKDSTNAELYHTRCMAYLEMGDVRKAIADITKAMKLDSANVKYPIVLADIYFNKKEYTRAMSTLEEALKDFPKSTDIKLKLAKYHLYLGQDDQSIKLADEVLQEDVYNAQAYFLKGMIFKEIKDTSRAISSFQTAIEQNPDLYEAYMQLGLLFSAQKDELAIDYFNNALKVNPGSMEALYDKAIFYQNNGDYQSALKAYRQIVIDHPQNKNAYYNIGYIYFQLDSVDKADRNFELAISVAPGYADAYYMRGLCAEARGDNKSAMYYYKQTLNLSPEHELALKGLHRTENL